MRPSNGFIINIAYLHRIKFCFEHLNHLNCLIMLRYIIEIKTIIHAIQKKVRENSLRRHLPTSILFNTHYSGLPDMTSSIWLTQDTKNEGNTCRLCFFDMYGLCSDYSSFCKYKSTGDSPL